MKRCPQCNRVEHDEALKFCRSDGATLVSDSSSPGSEVRMAQLSSGSVATEIETSILPHRTDANTNRATAPTTVLPPQLGATTGSLKRTRRARNVIIAGAAVVVLTIGLALFSSFYLSRKSSATIQSIAVMPFVNTGGNADVEYVSDGMTESLINSLSQLPNLSVKARSTVFRYKGKDISPQQIGADLSVQAVLNGRVVERGDQLTLSLDLVNARTGDQIWGRQYTRNVSDLVSLQTEAANDVSQRLRANISQEERQRLTKGSTTNPEAYQLYLKGNYFASRYTKEGTQKGIEYFNQAIAADPTYALAFNGLAYYYIVANEWYRAPHEGMPKAREAARKALAIDETLAPAHASLAVVTDWYDWDWASAQPEYKRAIELDPNDPRSHQFYAWSLAEHGQAEEAIAEAKRAQQLDPISPEQGIYLGQVLLFVHRYDEATDVLRRTVELDQSFWLSHEFLGRALEQKGQLPAAIAEFQRAIQLEPAAAESRSTLGHAYAVAGKRAEALKIIDELTALSKTTYVPPYNIAVVYAGLGDKDEAFAWLERAFQDRSSYLTWLTTDPELDNLKSDPRYEDLKQRVGLWR
jgi:TolB-like protein/Tfp pilus assembly protein PilF